MKNFDLDMSRANIPHLMDLIPTIVMRFTLKDNVFKTSYVNEQIQKLGYTVDDFMSNAYTWTDLIHPEDKDSVLTLAMTIQHIE